MIIGIVTGGFDPLHSGHIKYIQSAATQCDILCVGVNSDEWLERKKGKAFIPLNERLIIVAALRSVDHAIEFNDEDDSARYAIKKVKRMFPGDNIFRFMNGGDRTAQNIPEMSEPNVEFIFGVGGDHKLNSSSWLLNKWKDDMGAQG